MKRNSEKSDSLLSSSTSKFAKVNEEKLNDIPSASLNYFSQQQIDKIQERVDKAQQQIRLDKERVDKAQERIDKALSSYAEVLKLSTSVPERTELIQLHKQQMDMSAKQLEKSDFEIALVKAAA